MRKYKLIILLLIGLICIGVFQSCENKNNNDVRENKSFKKEKTIGAEKAKELMYSEVPNGKLVEFEYEGDEFMPIYIGKLIKVGKEYEISLDAKTGNIIKYDEERLEKDEVIYEGEVIEEGVAKDIILKRAGGGNLISFKYDGYDSIPIYEGIVDKGKEKEAVLLDARDGKVIGFEKST